MFRKRLNACRLYSSSRIGFCYLKNRKRCNTTKKQTKIYWRKDCLWLLNLKNAFYNLCRRQNNQSRLLTNLVLRAQPRYKVVRGEHLKFAMIGHASLRIKTNRIKASYRAAKSRAAAIFKAASKKDRLRNLIQQTTVWKTNAKNGSQ